MNIKHFFISIFANPLLIFLILVGLIIGTVHLVNSLFDKPDPFKVELSDCLEESGCNILIGPHAGENFTIENLMLVYTSQYGSTLNEYSTKMTYEEYKILSELVRKAGENYKSFQVAVPICQK